MIPFDWAAPQPQAMDANTVAQLSNPVNANQKEVLPWVLYDTQTVATNGAGPFNFYQTIQSDRTLGNLDSAAQLPDPQLFVISYITADLMQPALAASITAVGSPMTDMYELLYNKRGTFTLTVAGKPYGPWPLTFCHSSGGVAVQAYGSTGATTGVPIVGANNGIMGTGGWWVGGALIIPPKQAFLLSVIVSAALSMTTAFQARMGMVGTLYRRVV